MFPPCHELLVDHFTGEIFAGLTATEMSGSGKVVESECAYLDMDGFLNNGTVTVFVNYRASNLEERCTY